MAEDEPLVIAARLMDCAAALLRRAAESRVLESAESPEDDRNRSDRDGINLDSVLDLESFG